MYEYALTPHFCRQLKPLLKKYPSIQNALEILLQNFDKRLHSRLINNVYKCRLKVPELHRGKSGSLRVLILLLEKNGLLAPIAIYYKGDKESLSKEEIVRHLKRILLELEQM